MRSISIWRGFQDFIVKNLGADAVITYRAHGDDWFVISGTKGSDRIFYERHLLSHGKEMTEGFVASYPAGLKTEIRSDRRAHVEIVPRRSRLSDAEEALSEASRGGPLDPASGCVEGHPLPSSRARGEGTIRCVVWNRGGELQSRAPIPRGQISVLVQVSSMKTRRSGSTRS